ncbi:MAG: putative ABC transporter permease [Eggerthellaceae bacterium]
MFSVVGHWMEAAYCTLIRFGMIPGTTTRIPRSGRIGSTLHRVRVRSRGVRASAVPVKNFLEKRIRSRVVLAHQLRRQRARLHGHRAGHGPHGPARPDGKLPLWDYSDMFCNFMGQVCLQNAIAFGVVATLMTWVIYPALEQLLSRSRRHEHRLHSRGRLLHPDLPVLRERGASRPRHADDAGSSDATSIELSYSYDSEAAG